MTLPSMYLSELDSMGDADVSSDALKSSKILLMNETILKDDRQ